MATYDNSFATKLSINPATPNLRGMSDNFSNDGQRNLGGYGLGNIYELDYDRDKIEQIFNQGTDAQYALMQKEAQVAENNYANQQFQNQFNTIEALRAQRNEQIASGMARGLNAASDQATALGVQQEAMGGALELAQNRQMQADQIAAEYAQNVVKALQEANSVKQAMAQVAAQLYEADMLGYTGELSALGQMDANASDRYGYELGLEGTRYSADQALRGTLDYNQKYYDASIYGSDRNLEGTKYAADKNYAAAVAQANATRYAADVGASAARSAGGSGTVASDDFIQYCYEKGKSKDGMIAALQASGTYTKAQATTIANQYFEALNKSLNNSGNLLDRSNLGQYTTSSNKSNNTSGKQMNNFDKTNLGLSLAANNIGNLYNLFKRGV